MKVCGNATVVVLDKIVLESVNPFVLAEGGEADVVALLFCVTGGMLMEETSVASEEADGLVLVILVESEVALEAEVESLVEEILVVSDGVLRLLAGRSWVDEGISVCFVCDGLAEEITLVEPPEFKVGPAPDIVVVSGAETVTAASLLGGSILLESETVVIRLSRFSPMIDRTTGSLEGLC